MHLKLISNENHTEFNQDLESLDYQVSRMHWFKELSSKQRVRVLKGGCPKKYIGELLRELVKIRGEV